MIGCSCCDEMNSSMFIRVLSFGIHLYLAVVKLCMKLVGIGRKARQPPLLPAPAPHHSQKPLMVTEGPQPIERVSLKHLLCWGPPVDPNTHLYFFIYFSFNFSRIGYFLHGKSCHHNSRITYIVMKLNLCSPY